MHTRKCFNVRVTVVTRGGLLNVQGGDYPSTSMTDTKEYKELEEKVSSLAPECNKLKSEYDNCFKNWYNSYLKGEKMSLECESQFVKYRKCIEAKITGSELECALNQARSKSPFDNSGKPTDFSE